MKRYNHLFTIGFSIETEGNPEGLVERIPPHEIRNAIIERLDNLKDDELKEAIGCPDDTYEVDYEERSLHHDTTTKLTTLEKASLGFVSLYSLFLVFQIVRFFVDPYNTWGLP